MNRRGFFARTFGGIATACLAPFLPKATTPLLPTPQRFAYHPSAYALLCDPIDLTKVSRMDVLFGWSALKPEQACRVGGEVEPTGSFLKYLERERDLLN